MRRLITDWVAGRHKSARALWALRGVSFSLERGRVLGVIGHNGAGKTTLLRLLCGLTTPTHGRVVRTGGISGLLELGTGFHPDLTGRENVTTAALLNGLGRPDLESEVEQIVRVAELEEFIDQPLRTYSNGMYLRLAFAVAMHFEPEILVMDEVLSVGDVRFQKICLERLSAHRAAGRTLILTSHDAAQIRSLCDEVLVLEEGRMVTLADPVSALQAYDDLMRQRTERRASQLGVREAQPTPREPVGNRQGTHEVEIVAVRAYDRNGMMVDWVEAGAELTLILEYRMDDAIADMALILGLYNDADVKCFESAISSVADAFGCLGARGKLRCHIPSLPLLPGRYYINVGTYPTDWDYVYDYHWRMHSFDVVAERVGCGHDSGVVSLNAEWRVIGGDGTAEREVEAEGIESGSSH